MNLLTLVRPYFLISVAVFWATIQVYSQDDHVISPYGIMPSPEALAMAQFVVVPPGNYTGIPDISIPIYKLSGKDISLPLTLKYHSGVGQNFPLQSNVGSNWVLDGGMGLITRVINGTSDFADNGYIGANLPDGSTPYSSDFVNQAVSGSLDTGPDVFYFNFAGYKGRFAFTPEGELVSDMPGELKISPLQNDNDEWVIYDNKGYEYYFGGAEASEQTSYDGVTIDAVSSWYITKIVSPLNETLVFTYKEKALVENPYFSTTDFLGSFTAQGITEANLSTKIPKYYFVPIIDEINLNAGRFEQRLVFETYSGFDKTVSSKISRIKVYLKKDDIWKQTGYVSLTSSIIRHYTSEQTEYENPIPIGPGNDSAQKISVSSKPLSETKILYETNEYGDNLVSEIQHNTGKKIKYYFEPHDFKGSTLTLDQRAALGYRIDHIAIEGSELLETYFHYHDENNENSGIRFNNTIDRTYPVSRWYYSFLDSQYTLTEGNAQVISLPLQGPNVTYKNVRTESPGRGRITYKYVTPVALNPINFNDQYYHEALPPIVENSNEVEGLLKEMATYRLVNNNWLIEEKITNEYEYLDQPAMLGLNFIFVDAAEDMNIVNAASVISSDNDQKLTLGYLDIMSSQRYNFRIPAAKLKSTTTIYTDGSLDAAENVISNTSTIQYIYDGNGFLKKTITQTGGTELSTTIKYPYDLTQKAVHTEMVNRNMLSYPIETVNYRKIGNEQKITGGSIADYGFFMDAIAENDLADMSNEHILVASIYGWEGHEDTPAISEIPELTIANFKHISSFDYDVYGNQIEIRKDRRASSTIYDQTTGLAIAQVSNAAARDIYFNGFENDGSEAQAKTGLKSHEGTFDIPFNPEPGKEYILSYWYYVEGKWYYREKLFETQINEGEAIDEVRVYPKGAKMTTVSYDWKGNQVSTTDVNNISSYYDYNDRNQITNIRNNDKDIIQTIQHNYSYIGTCEEENVQPITASFKNGDSMTIGWGAYFDVTVIGQGGCGSLYYNWYLTDAGNEETYLGTTSHNIISRGSEVTLKGLCQEFFTVKCEVVDEYGTGMVTIRKHIKVDVDDKNVNILLHELWAGNTFPNKYCHENYDQISVGAYVSGGCGSTYTYRWKYTYREEGSAEMQTLTATTYRFVERFLGEGTLTCTVKDEYGNEYEVQQSIKKDTNCRD